MRPTTIALLLLARLVQAGQLVLEPEPIQHVDDAMHTQAITTIDILSSSPNHSTFLRLLQRTKLVPTLNLIQGSSIFAPTDEAWSSWGDAQGFELHSFLSDDLQSDVTDNVLFGLRQHLMYHILNYTLHDSPSYDNASTTSYVTTETTLLFPNRPMMPPAPAPHKPPTGWPWLPQGGDGDLGGTGQQLRLNYEEGEPNRVGCDARGDGGSDVWNGWPVKKKGEARVPSDGKALSSAKDGIVRHASNGVVIGIQRVLEPPPSLARVVADEPRLSYLSRLLGDETSVLITSETSLPSLASSRHLTLFAPSDDAFRKKFDDLELKYLESDWGYEGIRRVLGHHMVPTAEKGKTGNVEDVKGVVGWRSSFQSKESGGKGDSRATRVMDIDGNSLGVQVKGGKMDVNGTHVTTPDIFASNGVVHIIDDLLLPHDFKLLNSPEKQLLSLNATRFVSLLRMANLSETYTARHSDQPYTILAPTDDVLERMGRWEKPIWGALLEDPINLNPPPAFDSHLADVLKEQLLYHILPEKLSLKDLKDGMLLETELAPDGLSGNRQRIKVDIGPHKDNGDQALGIGNIKIGDAVLTAEPVETGNSIIYLISTLLEPPSDLIQTAVSDLSLSTFVASTFAAGLDKFVKRSPGKTYLAPQNQAFQELGLVMNYLLLPDAKPDLKQLMRYHMVDEVLYLNDIALGRRTLRTVAGEEIFLNRTWRNGSNPANITNAITVLGTEYQLGNTSTSLPANGDYLHGKLINGDMLTSTGTLHSIDRVILPADLDITIGKLIAGAKISTMEDLLIRAKMEWVLSGEQPSQSEVARLGLKGMQTGSEASFGIPHDILPAYTLLCPTDHAFSKINLTYYRNNEAALLSLLKLHLIPSDRASRVNVAPGKSVALPQTGNPLTLDEDVAYPTLYSTESTYGDLIMRNVVGNEWIVGVKDARGHSQDHNAGRLISWGRATPRWARLSNSSDIATRGTLDIDTILVNSTWNGIMTLGGGLVVIDNVLLPYEPSWFFRWGWLVGLIGLAGFLIIGLTALGIWLVRRRRAKEEAKYEALEGEEEE